MSTNVLQETIEKVVPIAREHADRSEHERTLAAPVVAALRDAGILRLCRPRELGGLEADPLTALDVVETLSRADSAAGWTAMINGTGGVIEAFIPPVGAKEIFTGPDVVVGGVLAPSGRAIEMAGGFRITGRWALASGCKHSDWLGATCMVMGENGPRMTPMGPEMIVAMVPAASCRVLDTWNVSGLRGSGSHDFEVGELFVPSQRCIRIPMMEAFYQGRLFSFPFFGFLAGAISSVALGLGRAAIDEVTRLAKTKTPFGMQSTLATRASAQLAIAEAEAELRAARASLRATVNDVWRAVNDGGRPSVEQRVALRLAATNATVASARAVDRAYTAGGATSLYDKSPLQRCFRDVHAITQHVFVAPTTYELLGKILLGVEPDAPTL